MNATIPFLTTMALGVMVGITGTHYKQIDEMVQHGARGSSIQATEVLQVHDGFSKDAGGKPSVTLANHDTALTRSHAVASGHKNQHENALLEILADMRREQKSMRLQIAETNRDMAEANFRLDATSNDFRPLRTDSERPQSMGDSTSPTGGDIDLGDLLLPTKP